MLKNNKGMTMPLVLIIMVVLSILGITLLNTSLADANQAARQENKIQANYLARSAVDDVARYIKEYETSPSTGSENLTFGSYKVDKIESSEGGKVYYIQATGNNNGVNSTVGLTISKDKPADFLDNAIYTCSDLDITNMQVKGDIGSEGSITYSDNGANEYDTDNYEAKEGITVDDNYEQFPITDAYKDSSGPSIDTTTGNVEITSDGNYNLINIPSNSLILNTGSSVNTLEIGVMDLDLSNSGSIEVTGNGLLKLYIYNRFDSKGNINLHDDSDMEIFVDENAYFDSQTPLSISNDSNRIRIYLGAGSTLDIQANGDYYAYIIGPEANIIMQSSQTKLYGAIFGNILNGTGNKPMGVVEYKAPDDSWELYNAAFNKRFYE